MQDVRRELGLFSDTASGLQHLGRNLTLAVTVPLVAGMGAAVKTATDFDAAMRNIASISEEAANNFDSMSERVRNFGAEIRGGPLAAAEALNTVFQAGWEEAESAFVIAQVAAKTAEAGLADTVVTTEALVAAMLSYGAATEEAGHYSDVLTRMVQIGVGSMGEFAGSLAQVLPSASALGVSFQDVGANLAFLTQRGFPASRAATSLNNAFSKLLSPTEDLSALYEEMGVRSGRELIETLGGIEGALSAIFDATGGDETMLKKFFPDERGFRAMASLFTNMETWADTMEAFGLAVDGATDRAHVQQMMSLQAQLDLLTSSITAFAISVGSKLVPFIQPLVEGLRDIFINLSNLPPEVLLLGTTFVGLVAAAGPLIWLLGTLLTPIGLLTGAVGTLAAAFATDFGGIRTTVENAVNAIVPSLTTLKDAVLEFFEILTQSDPNATNDYNIGYDPLSSIGTIPISGKSLSFEVLEGEGPWSTSRRIAEAIGGSINIDDLQTRVDQIVRDAVGGYHAGTYTINLEGASFEYGPVRPGQFVIPERSGFERGQDWFNQFDINKTQPSSIGDKIAEAISVAGPKIIAALDGIKTEVTTWFTSTFLPSFDTWGSDILNSISNTLNHPEDGNPLLNLLRSIFALDATEVTTIFSENLPKIEAAFGTLFTSISTWLQGEGARSLGEAVGYSVGALGSAIGEALKTAIGLAFGVINTAGGEDSAIGKAAGSLGQGIADGFALAMADSGVDMSNTWDVLFTAIAGSLASAIVAGGLLTALSGAGIAAAVSKSVSLSLVGVQVLVATTSWIIQFAGGAINGLATAIGQAITAQIVAGGSIKVLIASVVPNVASAAIGTAVGAGAAFVTNIGAAIMTAISTLPVVLGLIAVTLGAITFGMAANYDIRISVRNFLVEELGVSPIDIDVLLNILPIFNLGNSLDGTFQAMRQGGAAAAMAHLMGLNMNDGRWQVNIPTTVTADIQFLTDTEGEAPTQSVIEGIEAAANQSTLNDAYMDALGFSTGQKLMTGYKTGLKNGMAAPAGEGDGGDTTNIFTAILGAQLQAVDLTPYIPYDNLNTTANSMVMPFSSAFLAAFGPAGTLILALVAFNNAIVKYTPTIIGSFKKLGVGIALAMQPALEALMTAVELAGQLGSIGGFSIDGKGKGYASGGHIGAGELGFLGGRGVEPFVPGENGTIIPTRMVRDALSGGNSGGGGNTYVINAYGSSPYDLAQTVINAVENSAAQYR